MSVYKVTPTIAYDHDQGAFMFYGDQFDGLKMLPTHYVSSIEPGDDHFVVVCNTKHHTETIRIECADPFSICEKLNTILEEF